MCILIPVDPKSFLPFNSQEEVQEFINSNTDRLYIRNLKSLVNLIGVDLFKENNYTSRNTVPYGLLPDFYLSEPMIIGGLIIELEKQFPDIQFYNRVNSRDNMNKVDEVVYYDADIHLERSNRFNSNVISDPKYGKVKKSTIPVMFRYETTSAKRFMERRHQTLILNFLNRVTTYKFDIDANKYYNYTDDGFSCGVNWDGVPLEGDIRYSQDNSERTIYSFEMRCDIIGCIIEKNSEPHRIDEVINFIYVKSSEDKDNKLARLEEYVK